MFFKNIEGSCEYIKIYYEVAQSTVMQCLVWCCCLLLLKVLFKVVGFMYSLILPLSPCPTTSSLHLPCMNE